MNFNVCKKCKYHPVFLKAHFNDNNNMSWGMYCFPKEHNCSIKIIKNIMIPEETRKIIKDCYQKNIKNIPLYLSKKYPEQSKNIELNDKMCPYYAEHLIDNIN